MLTGAILTPEEFKTVHNALCRLRAVAQSLTGVLHDSKSAELKAIIGEFDTALRASWDAEEALGSARSDHYDAVSEQEGFRTVWSMDEVADLNDAHPYTEARHVVHARAPGCQAPILGPTWKDLWRAADTLIMADEDTDHIFIEAFVVDEHNPAALQVSCGS